MGGMTLNEYQKNHSQFSVYKKDKGIQDLTYTILALCGESGELANKLKKSLRSQTLPNVDVLADELGDVLWYVAAVAEELGYSLENIALMNLDKLSKRKANDQLSSR
jgi:NTP pyrophosphatase (non-canonical NTP hydrolase)